MVKETFFVKYLNEKANSAVPVLSAISYNIDHRRIVVDEDKTKDGLCEYYINDVIADAKQKGLSDDEIDCRIMHTQKFAQEMVYAEFDINEVYKVMRKYSPADILTYASLVIR